MIENKKFNPETIFLILGILIGGIYCVVIPYGAGFDEEQHMVRIYDISGYNLLPNRNPPDYSSTTTLKEFFNLSYQRRFIQSPAFNMFSGEIFGEKFTRSNDYILGFKTRSIYSPVIFFPQAITARIFWRIFDFPIFPVVILERLAGLMLYLAGVHLAIRALPIGKWMLTVLALSPMALFQASTLNADGFTNAASFLFIGLTLHVYATQHPTIQPRWIWALIGASFLLGFSKPGTIILLPLLLIFPKDRFTSRKWIIVLGLGAMLAALTNIGWTTLVVRNSNFSEGGSQSLPHHLGLILSGPGEFIITYLRGLVYALIPYFKDWTAAYGYWAGTVPEPVYPFYAFLLLMIALIESRSDQLSVKVRGFMAGLFVLSSAAIMSMYFVANYSPGNISVLGKQGRYFIPFAPLFFIALTGLISIPEKWKRIAQIVSIGSFLIVIGYYSFGLYATYYTDCGYDAYAGQKCALPIYKNLDSRGLPEIKINAETMVSQQFINNCNGLESVQVLVKSVPPSGAGTLKFSLLDENQRVLASQDIQNSEIRAGKFLTLQNTSTLGVRNVRYEIRLESLDLKPPDGIGINFNPRSFYAGKLSVAGQASKSDLIIRYVCTRP